MKVIFIGCGGVAVISASVLKKINPKIKIDIFTERDDIAYPPRETPF